MAFGTRANPYDVDEVLFDAQDDDDVCVITPITVDDDDEDMVPPWRRAVYRHPSGLQIHNDPPGHHMLFMYPSDSDDDTIESYTCPGRVDDSEDEIELC